MYTCLRNDLPGLLLGYVEKTRLDRTGVTALSPSHVQRICSGCCVSFYGGSDTCWGEMNTVEGCVLLGGDLLAF